MKLIRHLLLISTLSIIWFDANAQIKLKTDKTMLGPGVKPEELTYITRGAEQVLNLYAANADLFDPVKGEVSDEKKGGLANLFMGDAKVAPDYSTAITTDENSLTDYLEYLIFIAEKFGKSGFPFTLSNAKLEKIIIDEDLKRYQSEIIFTKNIQLGIIPGGGITKFPKGRTITERMVLVAEKQALTEPLILKIIAVQVESIDEVITSPVSATPPITKTTEKQAEVFAERSEPAAKEPEKQAAKAPEKPAVATNEPKPVVPPVKEPEKQPAKPADNSSIPLQPFPKPGQVTLNIAKTKYDPRLPSDQRQSTVNMLQKALNEYITYGAMLDPISGTVSDSYIPNFEKLFGSQAKVYNDITEIEPQELTNYSNYITLVYEHLHEVGVRFIVQSAILDSIVLEYDDLYKATISIDKKMLHYLAEQKKDGSLKEMMADPDKPRNYPLRINYIFKLGGIPKIENIESGREVCAREREERYVSVSSRFGISLFQSALSSGGLNNFSKSQMNATASNVFGAGIQFSSNTFYNDRMCKKPIFWTVGANYYNTTITTNTQNWAYSYLYDPKDNTYYQEASIRGSLYQNNRINVVEGMLGLRYRIKSDYSTTMFIDLSVLPSFIFSSVTEYDFSKGVNKVTFDGIRVTEPGDTTRTLEIVSNDGTSWLKAHEQSPGDVYDEYQKVGEVPLPLTPANKIKTGVGLSSRLGFSIYKRLNYSFGFIAGVDFNYNILTPIKVNNRTDQPFKTYSAVTESNTSLLQDYFSQTTQHSIGVRVGLYYRFKK